MLLMVDILFSSISMLYVYSINIILYSESYRGALSEEELDALDRLSDRKKKAIELLLLREQELKDIRDGIITTRKVCVCISVYVSVCESVYVCLSLFSRYILSFRSLKVSLGYNVIKLGKKCLLYFILYLL